MVLDGANGFELLMGVASIAGIFAVRKFLYVHSFESDDEGDAFAFLCTSDGDQTKEKKENSEKITE